MLTQQKENEMGKELTERRKRILHALVDLYIETGLPVSSADIQSKYLPEVSSATIRAELNTLEAMGYIEQPHTSAGRIPLKDAYKLYVDSIDKNQDMLTDQETAFIRNKFLNKFNQIEDLSVQAAKVISDLTNYTSFFIEKSTNNAVIEEIKLVPLKQHKAVVLIVTDKGMIADKAIDVNKEYNVENIEFANKVLNRVFQGKQIKDIDGFDYGELDVELQGYKDLFEDVLGILRIYMVEHSENMFVEGALKMLDYPEYNNVEDAKNFLAVISNKEGMSELLSTDESSIEFSVRIGKEDSGVDKCAIITAAYKVGDEVMGQAGVIGPERMDYKKVIGVLDCMKKTITSVINHSQNDEE